MKKQITIGSATFDDFEGVYFTYQSLRLNNLDWLDEIDFVIIDNNPTSKEGEATASFCDKAKIRYFPCPTPRSTAVRDKVFRVAEADFTLCIDPHVLFEPKAVSRLIDFANGGYKEISASTSDLFHGAMMYDYLDPNNTPATHMNERWRDNMFGTWGHEELAKDPNCPPWEIPMHGLGIFACFTKAWPGFSPLFKGFGGEEGYIHEKFKMRGGRTWCLPWLRWLHRFDRPRGNVYPLHLEERIRNYAFGWLEVEKDTDEILEHFSELHPHLPVERIIEDAKFLFKDYSLGDPTNVLESIHEDRKAKTTEAVPFTPEEVVEESKGNEAPCMVGEQAWNHTEVDLGHPLQIDIGGKHLNIKSFALDWSLEG